MQRKRVAVLGSTGSIGRQALEVIAADPERLEVVALCAGRDAAALRAQALAFRPQWVGIGAPECAAQLKGLGARVYAGADAAACMAALPEADIVINGVSGFAGTAPLLAALDAGKAVALANKESIICAHGLVEKALAAGGSIIPVDSEQSALFQCLMAGEKREVRRLILTASGGPFRTCSAAELAAVTPAQALRHPTWRMGAKITVDSASLFNKGLEIMEAAYLFGLPGERIEVLVHPESIVHSLVEYIDGSSIAQLSAPDMRLAIHYALHYPARVQSGFGALELAQAGRLTFYPPDHARFPALGLAYAALAGGGPLPIAYNGANEAAVSLFMGEKLGFTAIADCVEYAMGRVTGTPDTMAAILAIDGEARRLACERAGCLG